jgi:hypothetical protein
VAFRLTRGTTATDEASPNQWHAATDQHTASGQGDANQPLWWSHGAANWSNVLHVRFEQLSGNCTGIRVVLQNGLAGRFHYMHIYDFPPGLVNSNWQNWEEYPGWIYGSRRLGKTAPSQPNGCPWEGPHLHQSGNVDWWTDIWRHFPSHVGCGGTLYCWSGPQFKVIW